LKETHPKYTIQSINVAGAQSALQSQYETQAQQHRNDASIQAQHQTNTQDVLHLATAAGLAKASLEAHLGQTNLGKASIDQTNLDKTNFDHKSAESPQKEEG
jgi:Tfp pilus assembly protein PilW